MRAMLDNHPSIAASAVRALWSSQKGGHDLLPLVRAAARALRPWRVLLLDVVRRRRTRRLRPQIRRMASNRRRDCSPHGAGAECERGRIATTCRPGATRAPSPEGTRLQPERATGARVRGHHRQHVSNHADADAGDDFANSVDTGTAFAQRCRRFSSRPRHVASTRGNARRHCRRRRDHGGDPECLRRSADRGRRSLDWLCHLCPGAGPRRVSMRS